MISDKASFEKIDNALSGQGGAKIATRFCATAFPRPIPPKPQHENSCAGCVDHFLLDQMTVANELCVKRTNSPIVTLQTSVVSQRNSLLENSSENDESEEIIPSASDIIKAIERGKLKRESSGKLDKKSGNELKTIGRPSRCQLQSNLKCDGLRPIPDKKSAVRKIPPQVPAKPFEFEQRRLLLVSLEKNSLIILALSKL